MSAAASSRNPDPAVRHFPRFHAPALRPGRDVIELPESEARHAVRVLRLAPGAELELFNGAGGSAHGRLRASAGRGCEAEITGYRESPRPDGVRLRLAMPRGARQDWVIEKSVELGALEIIWFESDHGVARLREGRDAGRRLERWRDQAVAAAKQCGADWLPDIRLAAGLQDALDGETDGPVRVADWQPDARPVWEEFRAPDCRRPALYVGPEGGWSDAERQAFRSAGARTVHLGPRVLRAETAAEFILAAWLCARG